MRVLCRDMVSVDLLPGEVIRFCAKGPVLKQKDRRVEFPA